MRFCASSPKEERTGCCPHRAMQVNTAGTRAAASAGDAYFAFLLVVTFRQNPFSLPDILKVFGKDAVPSYCFSPRWL